MTALSVLIDGNNNMATRDWYATKSSAQAAARFVRRLEQFERQFKPSRLAVCWDGMDRRSDVSFCEEYKASRQAPHEDLLRALAKCMAVTVNTVGIDSLSVGGVRGR